MEERTMFASRYRAERDALGFFVCQYKLEDANAGSSLAFPIVRVRVQFLQSIESFGCIVELAHLETASDQLQQHEELK